MSVGIDSREVTAIGMFLVGIWIVFVLDRFMPLEVLGLRPRTMMGLPGIVAMPFLHGNFAHILSNTVPLIILLSFVALTNRAVFVAAAVTLTGGSLLWLFGRDAYHIGASGLVFGLASFLVTTGIVARSIAAIVVAAMTAVLYGGSMLGGMLPLHSGVSWDGHLFGAIGGIVVAMLLRR